MPRRLHRRWSVTRKLPVFGVLRGFDARLVGLPCAEGLSSRAILLVDAEMHVHFSKRIEHCALAFHGAPLVEKDFGAQSAIGEEHLTTR